MITYLDSSAIVKRYVLERGFEAVREVYTQALNGELSISFSVWNIGEVLEVLGKYLRRGWLDEKDFEEARGNFVMETLRLIKLNLLRLIPVRTRLLIEAWELMERHHLSQADALQIASARYIKADALLSADGQLIEASKEEGLKAVYVG